MAHNQQQNTQTELEQKAEWLKSLTHERDGLIEVSKSHEHRVWEMEAKMGREIEAAVMDRLATQ